ncbi:thiopeptide-type bacteriocin biosynthesis protein [Actinokineospora sp.]|uniref:thiopeptide-type bacteriocin biosynthesis protein n=1 Tax=Actinokineospora sp. TaxID=1872133 RepID=UPI00403797EA
MTRTAEPRLTRTRSWTGLHCHLAWRTEHVDEFLARTVGPLLDGLRVSGLIADWYFLRYRDRGPHLRVRVRGADWCTVRALRADLARLVAKADHPVLPGDPGDHPHGAVREVAYEPETERYGGPAALPHAEDSFCRSSELALTVLAAADSPSAKLTAAAELVMATALALGLDRRAAGSWLRLHGAAWRHAPETTLMPALASHRIADGLFTPRALAFDARWDRVARTRGHVLTRWTNSVRRTRRAVEGDASSPAAGYWLGVWGSHLHLLLNRIGLSPDEERTLCWLVAASALAPRGPEPFFADGVTAADRRYLEASRFRPGLPGQTPMAVTDRPRVPTPRDVPVALPGPAPLTVPLTEALHRRATGRGVLGGPITAADLATVLWTAQASLPDNPVHALDGSPHPRRPYPSAGLAYAARLAVLVRDIAGVDPGRYLVDEVTRTLTRTGPLPAQTDLAGMSMWFGENGVERGGTDLSAVPAVLGLSVDLGGLRARYGLRGLRFGFTEAGHLAQNLALVAAAAGLSLGMVGGFYDDVANDVFGLDGVDEALVYLLPLGRSQLPAPRGPE